MINKKGVLNSVSVVEAIIKNKEDKVLLLKRSKSNKFYVGKWQLPGGKVEFGEDIQKAIKREIYEEMGKKYSSLRLDKVFSLTEKFNGEKSNVFLMVFTGGFKGTICLSNDHSEAKFFSIRQVKKLSLAPLSKKSLLG